MRYKDFIEKYFLVDEPKTGKLVPFAFRQVQADYYGELVSHYDMERRGIETPVRELILKARRQGFSSLVLALFAADDLLNENPTESIAFSYKDEATATFRKRYRLYVTSYFAQKMGYTKEQIQAEPSILDAAAKKYLSVDGTDIELAHNKAHFYCGTASARTGGRGGVLQKLLFSEEAHYPDSEKMTAREIVDGTLRQVDIASGWVFRESTANGYGNYYEQTWTAAVKGESRFLPRFFSWRRFYTEEQFETIRSEFTDKKLIAQEYPDTPEEAFLTSGTGFFDNPGILELIKTQSAEPVAVGHMALRCHHDIPCRSLITCDFKHPFFERAPEGLTKIWENPKAHHSYTAGVDVAEGADGDYSVIRVIDNKSLRTVAKFKDNKCPPDELALTAYALGVHYNGAYMGVEVNKDGLWVNTELFKMSYPNMYFREQMDDIARTVTRKLGFKTTESTRPVILSELRKTINSPDTAGAWNDREFLDECLVFIRNKSGRPEAMGGKHDDEIMAHAIALEIRRNMPEAFKGPDDPPQDGQSYVLQRLEKIKSKKYTNGISQDDFLPKI